MSAWKRRLAMIAVLAIVGAACSTSGDGKASDGGASKDRRCPVDALDDATGPVEITFWHGMARQNDVVLTELTDDFNASQDQVTVKLAFQGTYDEELEKYRLALGGGDIPDLYQGEDTQQQFLIDSAKIVPVSACLKAAGDEVDAFEPVLNQYTVDGTMWSMPFNVSNNLLLYNRQAFENAGLDPDDPPETFDDLNDAATQLRESGATKGPAFAFPRDAVYLEVFSAKSAELYVNEKNGRTGRPTAAVFAQGAGKQYYETLERLVDDGNALYTGEDTAFRFLLSITTDDSAMAIASSATLGTITTLLPQYPNVTLGVAPAPGPTKGGVLVGGASLYISNESSAAKQAAAYRYAKWLTEPEQQARWHVGTGYLPMSEAAANTTIVQDYWTTNPEYKVAFDQLGAIPDIPQTRGPVMGPYAAVRQIIEESLDSMLKGGVPADQAVQQAQEDVTAALVDYNRRSAP
ncbi:MAG TPA: ABC transporter substrate-binding protein [Acidimicrobiia bacterium]|nr:ABC transporter substrate-binding protein [Acidimicrobiia bacterium]